MKTQKKYNLLMHKIQDFGLNVNLMSWVTNSRVSVIPCFRD